MYIYIYILMYMMYCICIYIYILMYMMYCICICIYICNMYRLVLDQSTCARLRHASVPWVSS